MTKIAKRLAQETLRTLLSGLDSVENALTLIPNNKARVRMRKEIVAMRAQMEKTLQEEHPEDFASVISVWTADFSKLYIRLLQNVTKNDA